jgi:hypothetical protein
MPFTQQTPRRETRREIMKNTQFAFDTRSVPQATYFNTLPVGMNHVVPKPSQRFPRLATDVVYRSTKGNGIPFGANTLSKIESGPALKQGPVLEKLMVTDWNRYY